MTTINALFILGLECSRAPLKWEGNGGKAGHALGCKSQLQVAQPCTTRFIPLCPQSSFGAVLRVPREPNLLTGDWGRKSEDLNIAELIWSSEKEKLFPYHITQTGNEIHKSWLRSSQDCPHCCTVGPAETPETIIYQGQNILDLIPSLTNIY